MEDTQNNSSENSALEKAGHLARFPALVALVPALESSRKDSDLDVKAPHPTKISLRPPTNSVQKRKGNPSKVSRAAAVS